MRQKTKIFFFVLQSSEKKPPSVILLRKSYFSFLYKNCAVPSCASDFCMLWMQTTSSHGSNPTLISRFRESGISLFFLPQLHPDFNFVEKHSTRNLHPPFLEAAYISQGTSKDRGVRRISSYIELVGDEILVVCMSVARARANLVTRSLALRLFSKLKHCLSVWWYNFNLFSSQSSESFSLVSWIMESPHFFV